ncbi:MAG: DUF4912 domain-containing protein, partial [Planctomycetes bacterium]|nr:DUF4912 domain-containing protein [Planctomycetota bacterium]
MPDGNEEAEMPEDVSPAMEATGGGPAASQNDALPASTAIDNETDRSERPLLSDPEVIRSGGRVSANTGIQRSVVYAYDDGLNPGDAIPGEEGTRVKADLDLLKEVPFLDPLYNETYLYLIPRDPETFFVIWEVGAASRAELRKKFGEKFFENNRLVLRVYQVTGIEFSGDNAHSFFEIDDWLADKNEYWIKV